MSRLMSFVFAVACLSSSAFAQQSPPPSDDAGKKADQAFDAALRDMMTAAAADVPSGETDQDFARLMVSYQKAAIAMAKTELRYGQDENLKALARDIVTMQEKEIALMKAWEDRKRGGH